MGDIILGVDVTKVRTSSQGPEFPLGARYVDPTNGKEYMYINADTVLAAGDSVTPTLTDGDVPFAVVPAAAVNLIILGIAVAAVADEGFGWIQTRGKFVNAKVADAVTQGQKLVSSATAGRLVANDSAGANPTQAEYRAGLGLMAGVGLLALSDGDAGNLGTVWIQS